MGLGGDVAEDGLAAPVLGLEAQVGELAADLVGLGALLVDLVDRDHHRDVGGLGVVDRLLGLRHDAVVGGDDDDRDVGDLGAAGAHRGERLVARGVEEGDRPPVLVDLVGADVLGDAAGLACGHLGLADRVEERGLAVVDVAHDRDHRRADDEILLGVVEGGLVVDLLAGVDDLDLLVELAGERGDRLVRERLGQGRHLALLHQLLDDLGARDAEALGDLAHGRAGVDLGRAGASVLGPLSSGDSSNGGRRRRPRLRGGRCGGPCDMWSRRAAWESITTRRRFLPASLPPRRRGAPGAVAGARRGASGGRRLLLRPARRRRPAPSGPPPARRSRRPS